MKLIFPLIFVISLNAQNVAYKSFKVFSKERNEYISTMLFYPTLEKEEFALGKHKLFISQNVALNGKIKKDKYPLIILNHGGLRSAPNQINWLAKSLVKEGFVVLVTRSNINKKLVLYEPWLRANDIFISLLDLKLSSFKDNIDFNRVYSVGFLLGATSLLLSNSAKIDLDAYKKVCERNESLDCKWYEKNKIELNSLNRNFIEKLNYTIPIKKAIFFDVELSKLFDKKTLKNINTKFLFINLSDMKLLNNSHFQSFYNYSKIENANVFSSFSLCTQKGELILKGTRKNKNLCFDKSEERKLAHKIILNKIIEYLK